MSTKSTPKKKAVRSATEKPVALIAGPTASGKSAVAISLAQSIEQTGRKGIVINADSAQVYSDLHVLSARPSEEEMAGIEHRLFGEWDGAQACSAADWAKRARQEIDECHKEGNVPILVGGTGMYLKVLLEGIAPIPEIDPEIRAVTRALPTESAYAALMIEDPERAAALNPGDSQRIARALEVKRSTGVTLADWQLAKTGGLADEVSLSAIVLMPERQWLYDRCNARFEEMLKAGAIAEVEMLLERGLSSELPVMRAIGVTEIAAYLSDEITREDMIAQGSQATRNYAKRQFTWLRNQSPDDWERVEIGPEMQSVDTDTHFASLLRH